jgi:hypothetical protein
MLRKCSERFVHMSQVSEYASRARGSSSLPDDKLRLVIDHSAGPYSINSMIDHQSIVGVILDGI